MSTIAITPQGRVTGSCDALVEAAAAVLRAIPTPSTPRDLSDDRMEALVAAVRIPWARIPLESRS